MAFLERNANSGSVSTGYDIDNSVKLEADNSEFFSKTPDSNSNRQTFTFSTWIKRTELGLTCAILEAYQDGSNFFLLGIQNDDMLVLYDINSGTDYGAKYSARLRDLSAWYHIVFKSDTTNGTAASRWQVYVNGVELTAKTSDYGTPPQNYNSNLNSTIVHNIGKRQDQSTFMSCYLAETHLVDGTALAPTAFGEFDEDSGIWKPIEVEDVTYGTNGFYLDYADSGNLGDDESGNGNDYAESAIAAADQATDTPTNNFCTWNPLWRYATQPTMTEGSTKTVNASTDWAGAKATFGLTNGKWYWEYKTLNVNSLNGIQTANEDYTISGNAQAVKQTMVLFLNGEVEAYDFISVRDDTNVTFTYNAAHTFGIALDMDSSTQTISFYQNGSLITNGGNINIDGLANKTVFPFSAVLNNTVTVNFGGYTLNSISSAASDGNGYGTFEFAPPSGYYAICSKNLARFG